jgi:hypothetical protein
MADCITIKVDSNSTGLNVAEEVCAKQLPTLAEDGYDPVWHGLEPNEYDDFGAEITTTARQPISSTRQRSKGTPTDLDAEGGFNQDHTPHNGNRLLPGFFFANWHEKPTTKPIHRENGLPLAVSAAVNSTDRYTVAAGVLARGFRAGQLILVSGFATAANNGLKLITEVADTYIGVGAGLVDETPLGEVIITVVGEQLSAGAVSMAVTGNRGTLTMASPATAADAVLTIEASQNADPADTVTIGDVVYTFVADAPDAEGEVQIGGSRLVTLANLAATINGSSLLTPAHPLVTAVAHPSDGTMTITAKVAGTVGNDINTDEDGDHLSWDGDTAGGTGFSFYSLDVRPGEWIYLGGDEAGTTFTDNFGFARIDAITNGTITFDKTTWDVEAEAAGSLTIRLFTGSFLQNEADPSLIFTHYYQFERTFAQGGYEYLLGSVANELTINLDLADKITVDFGFIAAEQELRTVAEGRKSGSHVDVLSEEVYNTTSDVVRYRLSLVDDTDSNPLPFFGYITEGTITINNNVSPLKVIGILGAADVNVGNYEVGGEITALFSDVTAIKAIRQNQSVTADLIVAKLNTGWVFDIPLATLGGGRPEIELNEPVTLPLEKFGARNPKGYTASYTFFDYLPDVAMPEGSVT